MEIHGQLEGFEAKNYGFFSFKIDGRYYATKDDSVIAQAKQLVGQQIVADVVERDAEKVNPNTNKPYVNRYLNAIKSAGQQSLGSPTSTPTSPATVAITSSGDRDGARIGRHGLANHAVGPMIEASNKTAETVFAILDALHRWAETGTNAHGAQAQPSIEQEFAAVGATQVSSDDDIPF